MKTPKTPKGTRRPHKPATPAPQRTFDDLDKLDRAAPLASAARDDLGVEMGASFVENITGADDAATEHRATEVVEEEGGPFVVTTGKTEFAAGTDASNPSDAEREPFPTS
jgi:hypothetical protein